MTPGLVPLSEEEVTAYVASSAERYAADKVELGGLSAEAAAEQARREMAELFPGGRLHPGHAMLKLVGDDGDRLGLIWLAPDEDEPGHLFIYDLWIEPPARRQGHGRTVLELAHQWARDAGHRSIGLHVFAGNHGAIALYESLGYVTTDVSMRRSLG